MAHRGIQAKHEHDWQRGQYAQGVHDGKRGHQGMYADQYYQKGYRRGTERRNKELQNQKRPAGHK